MTDYVDSGATISPCGKYRYRLWREWRGTHDPKNWRWMDGVDGAGHRLGEPKACVFIMLNPSTADGTKDDPTIRRCVGFAKALNYERLEVLNIFAYRATQPAALLEVQDPVGPQNLEAFDDVLLTAGIIICAWGAQGVYLGQDETVLGWCGDYTTFALGLTKAGHPRHPLYLALNSPPFPFTKASKL